jgi:hypothetical protein
MTSMPATAPLLDPAVLPTEPPVSQTEPPLSEEIRNNFPTLRRPAERVFPLQSRDGDELTDSAAVGVDVAVLSGTTSGSFDFEISGGQQDGFVLALNATSGAQLWVDQFGGEGDDEATSLTFGAKDGSVYASGTIWDPLRGKEAALRKYSALSGALQWAITWGTDEDDSATSVALDEAAGWLYVSGMTQGAFVNGTESAGLSDIFLTCVESSSGNVRWTSQIGSSAYDTASRVAVGPRGGVFVTGQFGFLENLEGNNATTTVSAFLGRWDYLGNIQFTSRLNSTEPLVSSVVMVEQETGALSEGPVYIAGYTQTRFPFVAKLGVVEGETKWVQVYRPSSIGNDAGDFLVLDAALTLTTPGEATSQPVVILTGYNQTLTPPKGAGSLASTSTGFVLTADMNGTWLQFERIEEAEILVSVSIASSENSILPDQRAFFAGTLAANFDSDSTLFVETAAIVMPLPATTQPTPAPTPAPTARQGPASSDLGLSDDASLWVMIIGPIVVVLGAIWGIGHLARICCNANESDRRRGSEDDSIYTAGTDPGLWEQMNVPRYRRLSRDFEDQSLGDSVMDSQFNAQVNRGTSPNSPQNGVEMTVIARHRDSFDD